MAPEGPEGKVCFIVMSVLDRAFQLAATHERTALSQHSDTASVCQGDESRSIAIITVHGGLKRFILFSEKLVKIIHAQDFISR